jgi:hypothetical protein
VQDAWEATGALGAELVIDRDVLRWRSIFIPNPATVKKVHPPSTSLLYILALFDLDLACSNSWPSTNQS